MNVLPGENDLTSARLGPDAVRRSDRRGYAGEQLTRTISTIIPLYNGAPYIEAALRSVMRQTISCHEIIVVDDGSTDDGTEIVRRVATEYPIKLLSKRNGGQSSARNFGAAHASGDLIALLDQDDLWYPNHLEELVKPFLAPRVPELGWVYSNLDEIDAGGQLLVRSFLNMLKSKHPKRDVLSCLREDMYVLPSASLIDRAAFNAIGGFDEQLSGYEDDDLFLRLFLAGFDNEFIDTPLSQWRIYEASSSYSSRMGKSRAIYARKLLAAYPDDPARSMYYTRDLLLPQFYRPIAAECRKALRAGDDEALRVARADLDFISGFLSPAHTGGRKAEDLLITAVIPLYNGARTIEQALRSVFNQLLPAAEIIVVDDGSTDDGAAIVRRLSREHPIKLLHKENGGQSAARNYGIARAGGDLIALLDQDDAWYPNHLERLAQKFVEPRVRELGWVYSNLDEIDEDGRQVAGSVLSSLPTQHPKRDVAACLKEDMFVLPSASLISRRAFEAVGGFDENLSGYEDDDLFRRLLEAGFDNEFIDAPLAQWRIYPTSASHTPRMARSRARYARKLLTAYGDDPARSHYYAHSLLIPRFYPQLAAECRTALRAGDADAFRAARADLEFLSRILGPTDTTGRKAEDLLISAVIPLYNGAPYIEQALRSVFCQLLPAAEIIVVDDGSTDDGPAIVQRLAREHPIKLFRKENGGQSSARNYGIARAGGDFIALLDQDDAWYPNHLQRLAQKFVEPRVRELGWVYSNLDEVDENGRRVADSILSTQQTQHPKRDIFACLRQDMFVLPSASLISRRAFESVGGFDEALSGYEDDDLFLRLYRAGYGNEFVGESLSQWRIYPTSSSYSPRMARSRAIYARKLLATYRDDPRRSRYYARDMIAPRFFAQMTVEYVKALRSGNRAIMREAADHLRFLAPHLGVRRTLLLWVLLSPVLKIPVVANATVWLAPMLRPVVRRILRV